MYRASDESLCPRQTFDPGRHACCGICLPSVVVHLFWDFEGMIGDYEVALTATVLVPIPGRREGIPIRSILSQIGRGPPYR